MFKTASFRVHNPSRRKSATLKYALACYHRTLKGVIERARADSARLEEKILQTDETGRPVRLDERALGRYLYDATPRELPISPLRDYLIRDAAAMLSSYYGKQIKGDAQANPPTMPGLAAPAAAEIELAADQFCRQIEWPVKPQQAKKIDGARKRAQPRVARRLEAMYRSWAATKAAGAMLRKTEPAFPHPLQFERAELGRGFLLVRRGNNFYCLLRLFSESSRYYQPRALDAGFVNLRTGEMLDGRKYPGLILPLELGREHHDAEFMARGRPKSAKLILRRDAAGADVFYVNMTFEFAAEPVRTSTFLGVDRGAAMIGAATVISAEGAVIERKHLEGNSFAAEMRGYERRIAEAQRQGRRKFNFRVRGRRADIIVGEYANALIRLAIPHKSQIVVEKLDARSMALFLRQSQVRKLYAALEYKAECAGLPKPIEVPAAFTSQTCARCGHKAPENRPKQDAQGRSIQDVFRCVVCGYEANADENASEIIALRGLHQELPSGGGAESARPGRGRFQKFGVFQIWLKDLRKQASDQRSGESPAAQAAGEVLSSAPALRRAP